MTNLDKIYIDQTICRTSFFDRTITNFYTPEGIRKMDALFVKRIRAFKEGKKCVEYSYNYSLKPPRKEIENEWNDTYESLKNDIEDNIHLHPKIKENLLYNLNIYNSKRKNE